MCSAIKPKLGFRAARPLFEKEPNFPYFNDCNGLRPTTKIDSLLRRKPRNRLGLIVKIDADLKRTVVEYQRVKAPNAEQTKTRYQNYCRKPVPAFRDHALKFHAAQPQRIANDADGGKRHGRRGDD